MSINSFPKQKREKGHRSFDLLGRKRRTRSSSPSRSKKSSPRRENTERGKREKLISSPPRVIYTTRVKEEQRENKSQRFFQGKFVFCATQREEKHTNTKTPSQRTTNKTYPGLWHFRRDQRRLFFFLFFLSYFRLARHLYICLLMLIVIAQKVKERSVSEDVLKP